MSDSRDDDLFESSPDPTPAPTAPSLAKANPGSNDDDDDDETTATRRSKLSERQQKFLAEQRREFHDLAATEYKLIVEHARQLQQASEHIAPVLARVLNKTHLGSWDELWPLVDGLYLRLEDCPCVFVLSGWCAAKEMSGPPAPPHRQLLEKLHDYGIYGRASALAADYIAAPSDDKLDALWAWAQPWPRCFAAAVVDGHWTPSRIKTLADAELAKRTLDLEAEFLFLERRVFWFTSAADDRNGGWRDFFYFALGYHYLPPDLKNDLGPYALTIRSLS